MSKSNNFRYPFTLPNDYIVPGEPSAKNDINNNQLPLLFTPLSIKDTRLKNRIVVSPMCMYSANSDGSMNDFHLIHYGAFAKGGSGMVMFEACAVSEIGRISLCDAGLWKDEHIEPMQRIIDYLHVYDCKASVQLSHAGRKSSTIPPFLHNGRRGLTKDNGGWDIGGASPIQFNQFTIQPYEYTIEDIKTIIKDFGQSARRCLEAGMDIIEIHSAHGYLIDSFLSPLSNKRTDEYGNGFEGRCKLLLDIIQEIRVYWPENKPLFIRLSCSEWNDEGGWTIQDTVNLTKLIMDNYPNLVDLIDCSSGGNSAKQTIKVFPLYQVPFSHEIKLQLPKMLTGAVGLITNGKDAESILQESKADLIFIGRPFLKNPFFGINLANDLNIDLEVILQYNMTRR